MEKKPIGKNIQRWRYAQQNEFCSRHAFSRTPFPNATILSTAVAQLADQPSEAATLLQAKHWTASKKSYIDASQYLARFFARDEKTINIECNNRLK